MLVNAGDIVTCQITTQTAGFSSADDVAQAAASILASEGIGVLTSSTSEGIFSVILAAGYGVSFQATLQVQAPTAYASETDLLSIVANAFYQATGLYPTAQTAPTVQTQNGQSQNTGLPQQTPGQIGGTSADTGIGDALAKAFDSLKSFGTSALLVLVVLVVGLIFVVGYSPNTRAVAGALA